MRMKHASIIAAALLLFSGTAAAQGNLPKGGLLGSLLGEGGVVPSLFVTLTTVDAEPLVDSLAGPSGLLQGAGGQALNTTLSGLLVQPYFNMEATLTGLGNLVVMGPNNGLLGGLGRGMTGQGDFLGAFEGFGSGGAMMGGGMVSGSGQGMAAEEIPLDNVDPATQAALQNGVALPGLE